MLLSDYASCIQLYNSAEKKRFVEKPTELHLGSAIKIKSCIHKNQVTAYHRNEISSVLTVKLALSRLQHHHEKRSIWVEAHDRIDGVFCSKKACCQIVKIEV